MRFELSCFFFPLMGKAERGVILSAVDWVCIFVLFVVWMRYISQGATGGWMMPDLVFKWFPLCEFSLFNTP